MRFRLSALRASAVWLSLSLTAVVHGQDVLYVDAQLSTGAGDGSSWSNAFQGPLGLQAALGQVGPFQRIYVTQGTYFAADDFNVNTSFVIPPSVRVSGGFLGGEAGPNFRPPAGVAPTVLSGDLLQDDGAGQSNRADNTRRIVRVISAGFGTTLDRLTIRGGRGTSGAGLFAEAPVSVDDCRFEDCFADDRGGAVFCSQGNLSLSGCVFTGNVVGFIGGGAVSLLRSQGRVDRCVFEDNQATVQAGAILSEASDLFVSNSVFRGNRGTIGPAIFAEHLVADPPTSTLSIVTSTFSGNDVGGSSQSVVSVFNAANVDALVQGCIFWGNDFDLVLGRDISLGVNVMDSIVESGHPGMGVSQADPLFQDAAQGDFDLLPGSPAIDAMDIASIPADARGADVRGKRRHVDDPSTVNAGPGFLDFGANEATTAISTVIPLCTSPSNTSGLRGTADAFGSASISANALNLAADNLPNNVSGFFIIGRTPGFFPNPGGQPGNLCLTLPIGRFVGPGQIVNSGATSGYSISVDLNAIPEGFAFVQGSPGDTWYFQSWHRDLVAGFPTSIFTDLAGVTLTP